MSRRFGFLTVAIAVAAMAAAGCGSSSTSKTAQPAATPPTPSTPSTGTGTSTAPTGGLSGSASTPIGSPIVRAALIKKISQQSSFPTKSDTPWADCVIKALQADGLKTVGDAQQHQDKVRTAGANCAKQVIGQH